MRIALLGNPNTGKSSIFNMLTGLRQHVGNFPGVTVDKKKGKLKIADETHEIIDFPGTYSIYPRSSDEAIVYTSLCDDKSDTFPDLAIVVVDMSNLERNLLLFSQVYDLQTPCMMVLNMADIAQKRNKQIDVDLLEKQFPEATIVQTNARVRGGKDRIIDAISTLKSRSGDKFQPDLKIAALDDTAAQELETKARFEKISELMPVLEQIDVKKDSKSNKLDKILVHPVWGYVIFALILLVVFQFIFAFATIPMDWIDSAFANLAQWTRGVLSPGIFTDLLTQGIIPGLGGVAIFIPQIALLFFFIAILEESGYLSRVVFIMDRLMRPLGLNGKSVVPLLSSVACAIPGVMAARTIANWKERMITIMVAPLMSCSARIPVYTILIAVVIPNVKVWGFVNAQGLVLFGLYALGTFSALFVALILKWMIKTKDKGFHILEMPGYKTPQLRNVGLVVIEKVKLFVWGAGKIIMAISIILWVSATYGPSERMENARNTSKAIALNSEMNESETNQLIASTELENSFIGIMGKAIEPVIRPIGYDWKIGISLITSFAAREVFVGSMATIYAVQDNGENNTPLVQKMKAEKRADGTLVYSMATGVSLMVFYVFAMQCMATLAVVKRETNSWKWPLLQIGYMGVLAYFGAWISYLLLS